MEKQIGFRATYTAPMFGPAVLVSMNRQANRTISLKKEVERAVRITDEKIQVTLKPLEHKINGADAVRTEKMSSTFVFTIQKVGSEIRTIDSRSPDGVYVSVEGGQFSDNGAMTPFLERCLN